MYVQAATLFTQVNKKLWTVLVVLRSSNRVLVHSSDNPNRFKQKAAFMRFFYARLNRMQS